MGSNDFSILRMLADPNMTSEELEIIKAANTLVQLSRVVRNLVYLFLDLPLESYYSLQKTPKSLRNIQNSASATRVSLIYVVAC